MMARRVSTSKLVINLIIFIYIGKCTDFITSFQDTTLTRAEEDPIHGKLKYMT